MIRYKMDRIRIKGFYDICATLDHESKTEDCQFFNDMSEYCGQKLTVTGIDGRCVFANDCRWHEDWFDVVESPKKGYFDGVGTWSEAIEKLSSANQDMNWSGEFVEIDGGIYFDLKMSNSDWWVFNEGLPLLTNDKSL